MAGQDCVVGDMTLSFPSAFGKCSGVGALALRSLVTLFVELLPQTALSARLVGLGGPSTSLLP